MLISQASDASLSSIVSAPIRVHERSDDVDVGTLRPGEHATIASAVPRRKAEFATVRACARAALGELELPGTEAEGLATTPILRGPRGAPVWPAGVVGSMTHCEGYRAAAVALTTAVAGIGIDAELHAPLPEGVVDMVAHDRERDELRRLAALDPGIAWDRLLFSIKESVYKAWFPLMHRWLGFEDVRVEIDQHARSFVAHFCVPGPVVRGRQVSHLRGRYAADADLIIAVVVLPAVDGDLARW